MSLLGTWWRLADREQFVTFFVIGSLALLSFMTLTFVTVAGSWG